MRILNLWTPTQKEPVRQLRDSAGQRHRRQAARSVHVANTLQSLLDQEGFALMAPAPGTPPADDGRKQNQFWAAFSCRARTVDMREAFLTQA